ncbi:glucose dehydrogenase [FAD, quinone]-like [Oppia nitens]|uniref:glucose dehydrogenase [FAD, quinone]-like n=1 Tax=Oppia nitens TaxID=1686743 RepID=UPI0023DB0907|nr:glucose dehydrogenase [FAD, quinone]-like [Oppia nitens]
MVATGAISLFLSVALFMLQNYMRHQSIITDDHLIQSAYDFIVVGSGSAGSIVASRLAESGQVRVLLLEAGEIAGGNTDIPGAYWLFFNSRIDWNYTHDEGPVGIGFRHRRIPEKKGRVIGGSGSINTLIYNRGHRRCFDDWAQLFGANGWTYKEVLPLFKLWENQTDPLLVANGYHGTSGPIQVTTWQKPAPIMLLHQQAVNEMGFKTVDINGPEQFGTMLGQAYIGTDGVRQSSANGYIDPNPYPHNLHILANAYVTRILFEDKRAVGVQYVRNGLKQTVFAKREVIVPSKRQNY